MNGNNQILLNQMLPPPYHEKAFMRFTISTVNPKDMLPSYHNGNIVREEGKSLEIENVHKLIGTTIKIAAVTCRPGYMDSKVVVRQYEVLAEPKKGIVDPNIGIQTIVYDDFDPNLLVSEKES